MVLLPNNRRKLEDRAKAKGMAAGIAEGIAAGKAEGIAAGKAAGKAEGIAAGRAQERKSRNAKLRAIAKKYGIPYEELGIDDED